MRRPAGVAADIEGRLVVSDTGGHRVLVGHAVGPAVDVQHVVGSGEPGFRDGGFREAAFREPRGVALSGDMVIVADRGNHAIRMIDLASRNVATMAGTGSPAEGGIDDGDPLGVALLSPWDVLLHEYDLYVAMAGVRRIGRLDLKGGVLVEHADAAGAPADGEGARPMALATDGAFLYVADAASSAVGRIPFEGEPEVEWLAGAAEEGGEPSAGIRVRGCAGLAWGQGNHRLWIADTGNDALRLLEPEAGVVETVEPFEATLSGPGGLASAGHLVYLADTGHDRVLRVDQIDKRVVELEVRGV